MDKAPAPTFVGIDVAKHRLDTHSRPSGGRFAIGHDGEGVAALVERLVALAPALVVLEATGGVEVRLAAALAAAGLPVAVVDPMWTARGGQASKSPDMACHSRVSIKLLLVRRRAARTATNAGTLFVPTAWVSHGA